MMKKRIVLLAALCSLACLVGCQREYRPNQNGTGGTSTGKSVNTQLVLSVATGTAQTKQTAEAVQAAGTSASFRGLDGAVLIPYKQSTESTNGFIMTGLPSSPTVSGDKIDLYRLFNQGDPRRIVPVKLPVGTNTLVFYGKSPNTVDSDAYGKLGAYEVSNTLSASTTYFELGPRLTDASGFNNTKAAIALILTNVMGTSLEGVDESDVDGINVPETTISWADYGAITDNMSIVEVNPATSWYIMEEKLSSLYKEMTGIKYNTENVEIELRAGSGAAVLSMIRDLWKEILSIEGTTATTTAEAYAKKLAQQIDVTLKSYFSYSEVNSAPDWSTLAFKDHSDYAQFPTNFNLMEGAAYLTFNASTKTFVYPDTFNMIGMDAGNGYSASNFYYPSELLYFGNSPVRTSNVEYSASDYPADASAWSSRDWANTGWDKDIVATDTRSVAMVKNIRYGVSMLETSVAYAKVDNTTIGSLSTNNPYLPEETVSVTRIVMDGEEAKTVCAFQLTGVIIGGQPKQVGWDFLPISESGEGFIYDKFNAIDIPASVKSASNYTVVFDNFNSAKAEAGTAQDKVHVALEFLNNSDKDFYGKNNWVRQGEHFYLIGELDPGDPQANPSTVKNITWPTDGCIIPPYNANGTSTQQPRIFIQDFKTTVTFNIGKNSLKYAYLTVPDLRSSNMTLGLSVDIQWRQGLIYDDVVVGQ